MFSKSGIILAIAVMTLVARRAGGELARGPEAGAHVDLASTLGTPGEHVALGYAVSPYLGYEFAIGLAPFATVRYGRWNSNVGTDWQLAAKAGLRWTVPWHALIPFVEAAAGYGQFVYGPSEAADIGICSHVALGVDIPAGRRTRLGVLVGLERLDGGEISHGISWLTVGLGATVFPF